MNWLDIRNLQSVPLDTIPEFSMKRFREHIVAAAADGKRVVQYFAARHGGDIFIYAVLAQDAHSRIQLARVNLQGEESYPSLTPQLPALHLFEREIYEQFNIEPLGHPWLKPVRHGIAGVDPGEKPYNFFSMQGEEVHEVGVGPIHAGIIEPGHFRFSCVGEKIHFLEIEHGFQHRGLEALFLKNQHKALYPLRLAESIAGDTVIGHTGTYVCAMEALSGIRVSPRVMQIRTIALELERIATHLGDLSALSGDAAYLTGNAVFAALRTKVINTTLALCGSRFGRGLFMVGGVQFDISLALIKKIHTMLGEVEAQTERGGHILFESASVLSRFEKTGCIPRATAVEIGMVGPAARASGVAIDVRVDFPYGSYRQFPVHGYSLKSGDVFARVYARFVEIFHAIRIIRGQIDALSSSGLSAPMDSIKPNQFVLSMTEGWRGEISHVALSDEDGKLQRYKIKDPSFNNWPAVALSVRDEGISDFPLCNKSFNLSYCGFDL